MENIIPTSNLLKPNDLTSAGIKINIVDWPAIQAIAAAKYQIDLSGL